jgi:flavin reductase (DIM6/NTAB) family NADH-FMN oxidoreductase RutF
MRSPLCPPTDGEAPLILVPKDGSGRDIPHLRENVSVTDAAPREFDLPIPLTESPFDVPEREELELGEGLEGDPAIAFRRTLGMFATGVTILTTRAGDQVHGMTANAFMSVSLRPPLVLISLDRRAKLTGLLHEGTRYGVSVLEADQAGLSDRFAGRVSRHGGDDDLPEPLFEVVHDTPLVAGALAHLVARVVRSYWGGDHSLFLGEVEFARYGEGRPLLFHGGRYEKLVPERSKLETLPRELVEPLLAAGSEVTFEDGQTMMRIGDAGDFVLLLLEGTASVERPGLSLLVGEGQLIGEIEALDPGGGRTANVTASGPVRCLAITRNDLRAALLADSKAALGLIEILASRFREA